MARFEQGSTTIHYEESGTGFPLLLIAPGGMQSAIDLWARATINPLTAYGTEFHLVAMDQRNAGQSSGPLEVDDPWGSLAADQLALMDHLGLERFLVMGCCIGGSYIMKLLEVAPERVVAAVLEQPIGIEEDNAHLFQAMWRSWGTDLARQRSDINAGDVETFGRRMWDGDFVVSVSRDFVQACPTPMLVLPGIDEYHPTSVGRQIAAMAPRAEIFEPWKDTPEHIAAGTEAVRSFLRRHTPA